tara:strand:+ start:511 stop:654 length:144 start_codon:yes stop_codon:yes gene_type:complete
VYSTIPIAEKERKHAMKQIILRRKLEIYMLIQRLLQEQESESTADSS